MRSPRFSSHPIFRHEASHVLPDLDTFKYEASHAFPDRDQSFMKKRDEVLVGLMLIGTIIIVVLGSLWLARGGLAKGYPLYAKFPWGAGLKQGQPVWLVGVTVGYVDGVELEQNGILITTLRITDDYKDRKST